MNATEESDAGTTPVMDVAAIDFRGVVMSVLEKFSPPVEGQAMLTGVTPVLPAGIFTLRSLRVGVGFVVAVAPRMCNPSLVAAIWSVIAGELSAGG